VTAKCYGGDISRKRKLWEKTEGRQKNGEASRKVNIPPRGVYFGSESGGRAMMKWWQQRKVLQQARELVKGTRKIACECSATYSIRAMFRKPPRRQMRWMRRLAAKNTGAVDGLI